MRAVSLFSGAGGMDLGLERAGVTTVAMCEIDKHARATLAHHWPNTPIHHDVTTFDARSLHGTIDLVHGGSPCQDLSVAGRRAGLGGERSGLFWHQCRIAAECAAPWVLWENVPGALSSNDGADFAAVLWGLTGSLPDVPADGWRNMGVVVGPNRWAAWRILDARWFGVAQRRRRVFVVSGPATNIRRGLQVLLESESVCRDSRPSSTPRQDVAGTLGGGSGSRGWAPDTDRMTFVPVAVSENQRGELRLTEYARQLTTGGGKPGQGYPAVMVPFVKVVRSGARDADGNLPPEVWAERDTAPTLNAMDNTGDTRATVLAVQKVDMAAEHWRVGDTASPLTAGMSHGSTADLNAILTESWTGGAQQDQFVALHDVAPTLTHSSNHNLGHHEPKVLVPVTYPLAMRGRDGGAELEMGEPNTYNALRAGNGGSSLGGKVLTPDLAVRRLTPVECERLMGWPDGHAIGADSHRYKQCGNGVVAPVAEWIGRRLMEAAT